MAKRKNKGKVVLRVGVTEQDLATARYNIAQAILASENGQEILLAMQNYVVVAALNATSEFHLGHKKKAKRWKHAADEMHTIFSCAVLNAEERASE